MKNILITGGNGYIASSLNSALRESHNIHLTNRQEMDLTNSHAVNKWFEDKQFDVVIHTAISGGSRLKEEDHTVTDNNLKMYYNLLNNKNKFNKLINIGSGAEISQKDRPYGLSKHVIRQSVCGIDNFYNIRVFAVFDENELNTRFIKANIKRYINKEPMMIDINKRMDFFYMIDFVNVIRYYIEENTLRKEFDCTYKNSPYLLDIALEINKLSDYNVPINVLDRETIIPGYTGIHRDIGIEYVGLHRGISSVYDKLCKI